ncbi:MAG: alpha/beta hydrolase [Candidatus Abyssobacteria bacterium SURF_17]|uniref:Alpha/beta hydrolase n=1 Tax=Candidatus Abyssobacteria bacterium SURF_17 TaxID=2093361 RepID=A0A419F2J1_9BACT|nr:MAG: alpha/beta hydrolase [Candidatus Abyssubacteria bacterium SURF_17]
MFLEMAKSQMAEAQPSTDNVEEARAYFENVASMFPLAETVQCEPIQAGTVRAEWIMAPEASNRGTILYLHGGGYVVGSLNTHREMISRISRAAATRCLAIEYRLAPENPFPAAVEDAVAAYRWLLSSGVEPKRIVIAGDSAGGGLTVATLVALRDAGERLPAAAVCLSPWVDLALSGESMTSKAEVDPFVDKPSIQLMATLYLNGKDPHTPLASPLYADVRGLPPMLIQVGTAEVLLDDSTRLAERAQAAGVDVTLEPSEHMVHVWHYFGTAFPEIAEAVERIGNFIQRHVP